MNELAVVEAAFTCPLSWKRFKHQDCETNQQGKECRRDGNNWEAGAAIMPKK
jgi:hypothetical protein